MPPKKSPASKKRKTSVIRRHQKPPLDVVFLHKTLQKGYKKNVDPNASFFLESVLNYLGAELLELSHQAAMSRQIQARKRGEVEITAADIKAAIESDEELKFLINAEPKPLPKAKSKAKERAVVPLPEGKVSDPLPKEKSKSKEKAVVPQPAKKESKPLPKAESKTKEKAVISLPEETEPKPLPKAPSKSKAKTVISLPEEM